MAIRPSLIRPTTCPFFDVVNGVRLPDGTALFEVLNFGVPKVQPLHEHLARVLTHPRATARYPSRSFAEPIGSLRILDGSDVGMPYVDETITTSMLGIAPEILTVLDGRNGQTRALQSEGRLERGEGADPGTDGIAESFNKFARHTAARHTAAQP
jgi:hypothetical protein